MRLPGQSILKKQLSSGLERNKMKKKLLTLLTFAPLALCSCEASSYSALMLITSKHTTTGSISFSAFEGQYVFKLKRTEEGEGTIKYTASLEEGHMEVLYKATMMDEYEKMFDISGGETKDGYMGYLEKGYKVTIIVRSDGKAATGSFTFDTNYDLNH